MNTKRSLLTNCVALCLCFVMLLGTTFAWFTDVVTSSGNKIQSGSLKLDLLVLNEVETTTGTRNEWVSIKDDQDPLFTYDNWEPGYTDVTILKVENLGSLALKWEARFASEQPLSALAQVIDVYVLPGVEEYPEDRDDLNGWNKVGTLNQFVNTISETTYGYLDGKNSGGTTSATLGIALKMQESAGNEYQNLTLGEFDIRIVATQATKEEDSFGDDYDENAQYPQFSGSVTASAPVTTDSTGKVTEETTVSSEDGSISTTIPEGVLFTPGTTTADLSVSEKEESESNIMSTPAETMLPIDVHIEGVAEGNTVPIPVTVKALLQAGLSSGNYNLYHVENGVTVQMTPLADGETPAHNTFTYDPATGDVTLYLASFSEIAVTAYSDNKWNGDYDFSWYVNAASYKIANADQLAAFSAIVGGMVNNLYDVSTQKYVTLERDSFAGKTVTLICDINIGDTEAFWDEDPSENGIMFYPIGYYNNTGSYTKRPGNPNGTAVVSGFQRFEGTFDGNGHTISNFYQNTWEAFGDYNDGYAGTPNHNRDGFGLFGKVYGGTVKNLTVDNFSSDGEFTTTGVIAAYADGATFENIAVVNCNPRVYNIGNGGIVGCVGWYATDAGLKTTFNNVTVDNSNKITALWGSWDVACGGIVGQYYPTSGQSSAEYPVNGGMHFDNCHSSAIIDVYNDVCANYQYYAYRYSGLLIGSVRENETIDGREYPKMDGITAVDCTVHFGDWNDYYYCEIVANSLASYTHDHQMSRLTQVAEIDVANMKYLPLGAAREIAANWKAIPTSGWAHYVVVTNKDQNTGKYIHGDGSEFATCYHFNNGSVWTHDMAGTETVGGETVLKEDKQLVYREFNNLVTGYGWGVTSKGLGELDGVTDFDAAAKNPEGDSYEKFEAVTPAETTLYSNTKYPISNFFAIKSGYESDVVLATVTVSAMNLDTNDQVIVKMHRGKTWDTTYVEFLNAGTDIALSIQDYYYCTPTTSESQYTLKILGRFLYHNDSFPQADDFSEEWVESDPDSSYFKTSGETTYYYIDYAKEGGTNSRFSKYFYVETEITIHEIVNGAQWPKIGFMSGGHYKDVGQETGTYRMTTFYLAVNRSKYNSSTGKWDLIDQEDKWYQFGVSEVYNQYGWGWNLDNDTIFSNSHVASLPSDQYEDGKITFNETFKIALLRDGLEYHFFVNDQYLYTYIIDPESELYGGRDIATDIGFFHFDSKATYSDYMVYRFGDSATMAGHDVVGTLMAKVGNNVIDSSPTTSTLDWCYHSFIHYPAKGATCGEDGNIEYNHCVKCGLNYGPDEAKQGKTSAAMTSSVVIPALDAHDWNDNVCTKCGQYKIIVNHLNLDGSAFKPQETVVLAAQDGIVTYTVNSAALSGVVPSHDYVMVDVTDDSTIDEITIYYSEIDVWDGVDVSTELEGSGTAEAPYLIQSAADLAYLASLLTTQDNATSGQYYKMTKSIDLAKYDLYLCPSSLWSADRISFLGYFDGNNCTIRNIDQTKFLFGIIEGGYLKNLSFYGKITNTDTYAGVIGYMLNSYAENLTSYVNVTGKGHVGGIIANFQQDGNTANLTSTNLVNYGKVVGTGLVGGIGGLFGGNLTNSVNWGNVTGTERVGGVVGSFNWNGTVTGCKNYGDVRATSKNAAGIAGNINASVASVGISDCTNYGAICGYLKGEEIYTYQDTITATVTVTNNNEYGSVHHYSSAPTLSGTILTYTCSICKATKQETNVSVWDGTTSTSLDGSGTEADPYLIKSGADLAYLDQLVSAGNTFESNGIQTYFKMTNSIDLNNKSISIGVNGGWVTGAVFGGVFDGNGYSIVNLETESSSANEGLFHILCYATVKNLIVTGSVSGTGANVGGIVGYNHRGTVENCTSYVNVTSTGACTGGIAGLANYSKSKLDDPAEFINCVNFGSVTGTTNVGGIVGAVEGIITGCANYGTVTGNTNVGGVYGIEENSTAELTLTVTESFNDGTVINTTEVPATWDGETASTSLDGAGTEASPYLISSGADLAYLANQVNAGTTYSGKYFKMTNSIDLGDHSLIIGNSSSTSYMFRGTFDGAGYCIVNLAANGGTVSGTGLFGGVIDGTVKNLTVFGSVEGTTLTGGIVGQLNSGTVENCVSHVNVTGTGNNAGGIVGKTYSDAVVSNCINFGNVKGTANVGGIVGYVNDHSTSKLGGTIDSCTNYGTVTGTSQTGTIYGKADTNAEVTNCPPAAWDGTTVSTAYSGGSGTEADPYLISSAADLAYLAKVVNEAGATDNLTGVYFKMTNDINLNGKSLTIGSYPNWEGMVGFSGVFDGNGYSIINLKISESTVGTGLFSVVRKTGVIKNLTVRGSVTGTRYAMTGGIVGLLYLGTVENCTSYVTVNGKSETGGIVGTNNQGTVKNCVNYGTVIGTSMVGGVVGKASNTISGCTNYGVIVGTSDVGQIYGGVYTDKTLNDTEDHIAKGEAKIR